MASSGGFSDRLVKRRGKRCRADFCEVVQAVVPKDAQVVDLGAGAYGGYVHWMRANGWPAVQGIDASQDSEELSEGFVKCGDITKPETCAELMGQKPEWIIFREVGEHIPAKLAPLVFCTLSLATKGIVVSWANIGQRGSGHVNCHMPEWVACEMGRIGFVLNEHNTQIARKILKDQRVMIFNKYRSNLK